MEEATNPYQSPNIVRPRVSWWRGFCRVLLSPVNPNFVRYKAFRLGKMELIEGIGFVVDPSNRDEFYAVSIGNINDESRVELIRKEALRVQPQLAGIFPKFACEIKRRKLVVVVTEQYSDYRLDGLHQ